MEQILKSKAAFYSFVIFTYAFSALDPILPYYLGYGEYLEAMDPHGPDYGRSAALGTFLGLGLGLVLLPLLFLVIKKSIKSWPSRLKFPLWNHSRWLISLLTGLFILFTIYDLVTCLNLSNFWAVKVVDSFTAVLLMMATLRYRSLALSPNGDFVRG